MLPDNLANSYEQYKRDTSVFATWLCNVAEECGYSLPSVAATISNPRTRLPDEGVPPRIQGRDPSGTGKARRIAHARPAPGPLPSSTPRTCKVNTREILVQVKRIASSKRPRITVPLSIQGVLRRAIVTRTLFSSWMAKEAVSVEEKEQWEKKNESHVFFISVLEECWNVLEECFEKRVARADRGDGRWKDVDGHDTSAGPSVGGNRYESLDVEDCEDFEDLDITVEDVNVEDSIPRRGKRKGGKREKKVCEFDVEEDDGPILPILCFFEDLHKIRKSLKETWRLVQDVDSPLDWKIGALITNLALDSVRIAELEMIASNPDSLGIATRGSYEEIVLLITSFMCNKAPKLDPEVLSGVFLAKASVNKELYQSIYTTMCKYSDTLESKGKFHPWARVMSASELGVQLQGMEPKSPKWINEDQLLTKMMLDLNWGPKKTLSGESSQEIYLMVVEDVITDGLRKFVQTGSLALWQVFAARLALDIVEIMDGDAPKVFRNLVQKGYRANELLGNGGDDGGQHAVGYRLGVHPLQYSPFGGQRYSQSTLQTLQYEAIGLLTWIQSNTKAIGMIDCKYQHMEKVPSLWPPSKPLGEDSDEEVLFDDAAEGFSEIAAACDDTLGRISSLGLEVRPKKLPVNYQPSSVEDELEEDCTESSHYSKKTANKYTIPSSDPCFYHSHSPVLCGMQLLNLEIAMEKLGVALVNQQASLVATAQLYNAARQVKLLGEDSKWIALDKALDIHIDQFFKGSVLPTTPGAIVRRYMLTMGFPLTTFARNVHSRPSQSDLRKFSETKKLITLVKTSPLIRKYMDGDATANDLIRELSAEQAQAAGQLRKGNLTRLEMLMYVRDWLPKPFERMETDWISLTRATTKILWKVKSQLTSQLGMFSKPIVDFETFRVSPKGCEQIVVSIFENAFGQEMQAERASGMGRVKEPKGEFLRIGEGNAFGIAAGIIRDHVKSTLEKTA